MQCTDMEFLLKYPWYVVLNLIEKIFQKVKTEFDQIFKHLKVCQNVPLLALKYLKIYFFNWYFVMPS